MMKMRMTHIRHLLPKWNAELSQKHYWAQPNTTKTFELNSTLLPPSTPLLHSLFQLATIADTIEHVFPVLGGFHALRGVINSVNKLLCVQEADSFILFTIYMFMNETEWNWNCDPFCSSVDYQEILHWDFGSWAFQCLRRRCVTTHTHTHTFILLLNLINIMT